MLSLLVRKHQCQSYNSFGNILTRFFQTKNAGPWARIQIDNVSVEERSILYELEDLEMTEPPQSNIPFLVYKSFPNEVKYPKKPKNWNDENLSSYMDSIISKHHLRSQWKQINDDIKKLTYEFPTAFSKEQYIKMLLFLHYTNNHKLKFEVLNHMLENTNIKQDIDFHNIMISPTTKPPNYPNFIDRLSSIRERKQKINLNTWYYSFLTLKSEDAKFQLLEYMHDNKLSILPLLSHLTPIAHKISPQDMKLILEENNIDLEIGTGDKRLDSIYFDEMLISYLNWEGPEEAWKFLKSFKKFEKYFNITTFVTLVNYFRKKNQLGFCFALSNYFYTRYHVNTSMVLLSILFNTHLTACEPFDKWRELTMVAYDAKDKFFVSSGTLSSLHDYATLHKFDPHFENFTDDEKKFRSNLFYSLRWSKEPIFELSKNNNVFKKMAKLIGQKE